MIRCRLNVISGRPLGVSIAGIYDMMLALLFEQSSVLIYKDVYCIGRFVLFASWSSDAENVSTIVD